MKDLERDFKKDFPLLSSQDIAYLDNAATEQRPRVVLDAEREFYERYNANPLRGIYDLGVEATEQYEAARIDGATRFQKIIYITLPGIMPTTVILLIMQMGSLFSSDFQKILLMYSPSIYETADVISTYTYRYGIENANYGYASAIGLMLSVISFVFVWIANGFSRRVSENSLW